MLFYSAVNRITVRNLDGELLTVVRSGSGTYVAMENLDSDVLIGRYSTTYANGQIADIKIWGKELSSTEVLQIYQSEIRRYQ